jgi:hypothetical protein
MISGGGPASCVLGSSGSSIGTTGSGASDTGAGDGGRSLPRATTVARWAQSAAAVMCAQAAVAATMLNTEGVADSLSVHQLLHFFSVTRATAATTISTALGRRPPAQLEDELVFKGKECQGPK